ncbi:hypothetical protein BDZ85DRAFT_265251 [Elsinoe ampelina]|uniref:intramembrane prenyl-peptidase Rce1 n=1 Tax=Elsinoe ampelina TaxID=302913 RepID=A0A6A6G6P4_9PEZI|nr:hypothetical protein BDZ85DRAFT_265251 [Elsinoe ampelina]
MPWTWSRIVSRALIIRNRMRTRLQKTPLHGYPPITHERAVLIAIAFALAYVAPFYLSKSLRISEKVSRNSPESIRARCYAVLLTCCLCTAVAINVQGVRGIVTPVELLQRAGVYPIILTDVVKTMCLVAVLFAAPLYEAGLVEGGWRQWFRWHVIRSELYDDWVGWRNFVVGPVSEEVMFRSLNVSLLMCAWTPAKRIVWEAPLLFGVAHLHHLNEFIITHKRPGQSYLSALITPQIIIPGIIRTLFQLAFTTLFGIFVTFVLLRTGNIYSCILAHTFCNWMGLPRVWGRLGQDIEQTGAHAHHEKRHQGQELDDLDPSGSQSGGPASSGSAGTQNALGIQWTVVYYLLLAAGVVGFWKLLYPLTESDNKLVSL